MSRAVALAGVVLVMAAMAASPATAAMFTVDSAGDAGDASPGNGICATASGVCTLRAAIEEANASSGGDVIDVPPATIGVSGPLTIASPIEVRGAGAASTVVDGNGSTQVVRVTGGPATLRGLTIRRGDAQGGGGLFVAGGGAITVTESRIRENEAFTGGGGLWVSPGGTATLVRTAVETNQAVGAFGGGAYNAGNLFVHASLVAENDSNRAGGIYNAVGAVLNLRNTTISTNTAHSPDAGTGGLVNAGFAFLNNVTITENTGVGNNPNSFRGGGLLSSPGATTVVKNSIIAGNAGGVGPPDCAGELTPDSRYNLIGSTTGCQLPVATDTYILNVSPQLGPLTDNGGPTRSHLPAPTSPAVNAGYPFPPGGPAADSCEASDQRGVLRLLCDMGAVEREVPIPAELTVTTTADQVDALPGDGACATAGGDCSLRAAVQESNRLPERQTIIVPPGLYEFALAPIDEAAFDPAAGGDLDLLDSVVVAGTNRSSVIVDGNDLSRVFEVHPATGAFIRRLTIRDGNDAGGGGVRVASAALTLTDAIVEQNQSSFSGGGVQLAGLDGVLTVRRSLIRNNQAPFFGGDGAGIDGDGTITVERSNISGNQGSGAGGGLRASGAVRVVVSTIANNTAAGSLLGNGGGISAYGLVLVRSTVAGNRADAQGGGVFASGSITNSTISGNASATSGGGVSTSGTLSLIHVTVARNTATAGGSGIFRFGAGSILSLRNTILANAPGTECAGLLPTSAGGNIATDTSCNLTATGDRQATNALLGPLANNGGRTLTHLPGPGSPAIDAALGTGVPVDQRGVPRPQGNASDVGAVERR